MPLTVMPMMDSVLYLGDTKLTAAAAYLAGVMCAHNIDFDYLPSDEKFVPSLLSGDCRAVILSDYPAQNFSAEQLDALVEKAADGMGLLMIGGWESFTGSGGDYNDTILTEVLPVVMQDRDDRVNCAQPCLIEKAKDHEILGSLPFEQCPPCVGGFNRFAAKPDAGTILLARRFNVSCQAGDFTFTPQEDPDPLLVVGSYGQARACALATDVAPHWVGGLIDWGDSRLKAQAPAADPIEVGNWYATFLANMVKWTAQLL